MIRPLLFALGCFLSVPSAYSQKTAKYYDYLWHEANAANARFLSVTQKTDSGWLRQDYFIHSLFMQMEGLYADSATRIPSGSFRYFHPSRIVKSMGAYRNGKKQGLWLNFYSDGALLDSVVYDNDEQTGIGLRWHRNGYLMDSANYNPDGSGAELGWFDNGNPSFAGRYAPGFKKYGKWLYFYRDGGVSETETYDRLGLLRDKQYFDEKGAPAKDTAAGETRAKFPGGMKAWGDYLGKALYFPDHYQITNADQAAVVVAATIDEEGRVTEAEIVVPFYPAFDKIALDALRKAPRWIPAYDHHRKIRDFILQPVVFREQQ